MGRKKGTVRVGRIRHKGFQKETGRNEACVMMWQKMQCSVRYSINGKRK